MSSPVAVVQKILPRFIAGGVQNCLIKDNHMNLYDGEIFTDEWANKICTKTIDEADI